MNESLLGRIVSKALQDEAFKQQLIADPDATLAHAGVTVPEGISVRVVEDTASVRHLVLPAVPQSLTEAELAAIAAGESPACQIPYVPTPFCPTPFSPFML
jgi:hypothetical protein